MFQVTVFCATYQRTYFLLSLRNEYMYDKIYLQLMRINMRISIFLILIYPFSLQCPKIISVSYTYIVSYTYRTLFLLRLMYTLISPLPATGSQRSFSLPRFLEILPQRALGAKHSVQSPFLEDHSEFRFHSCVSRARVTLFRCPTRLIFLCISRSPGADYISAQRFDDCIL